MSSILTYSVVILLFVLFMYYYVVNRKTSMIEKFQNINSSCPNVLIEKDGKFYLLNSKKQEVPGVNPIVFENLNIGPGSNITNEIDLVNNSRGNYLTNTYYYITPTYNKNHTKNILNNLSILFDGKYIQYVTYYNKNRLAMLIK